MTWIPFLSLRLSPRRRRCLSPGLQNSPTRRSAPLGCGHHYRVGFAVAAALATAADLELTGSYEATGDVLYLPNPADDSAPRPSRPP